MKNAILILLFCIVSENTVAQLQKPVESVRIAIEASSSNVMQSNAIRYSLIKSRQIKLSRWDSEVSLGYINYYRREQFSPYNYYYKGNRSQRIGVDLTFLYNLISTNRNTLRIGAGPGIWHQRNGRVTDLSAIVNGQQIEKITFSRHYSGEFNFGLNLKADYEYRITDKLVLGVRTGVATNFLTPDASASLLGTLFSLGFSAGYRL
ncbi:hypothetical protein GCM10028807_29180 [Spirosoma daeguense]